MLTYADVEQELRVRMQRMVAHNAEQQAQVSDCPPFFFQELCMSLNRR